MMHYALAVGMILASMLGILGVLVVLRRMSLFADAIGHSALTGIALGLVWHVNPFLAALAFTVLAALGISGIQRISRLPIDTLLGILFATSVAFGVSLISLTGSGKLDLEAFLFGDITTVNGLDVVISTVLALLVLTTTLLAGKSFISITLDRSLAQAEGTPVKSYELLFLVMLAVTLGLAIKLVGVILVTALLVIPAATAQNIARSLASMFISSLCISLAAVVLGLVMSRILPIPSGPAVVLTNSLFFTLSLFSKWSRQS